MSLAIPFVQFDLAESMDIAGNAALVAENNDPGNFAEQLVRLTDDRALRQYLGHVGETRAAEKLIWDDERTQLLNAYSKAMERRRDAPLQALAQKFKPAVQVAEISD